MPSQIVAQVARGHARQLALCVELETIADELPASRWAAPVDRQRCLHAARAVCRTVFEAQAVEERLLFPLIESATVVRLSDAKSTVERLRWEHVADLCFAEEIHDALLGVGKGESGAGRDALGYMLRGFFEGVRRHVAFEREILAPLTATAGAGAGTLSRSAS